MQTYERFREHCHEVGLLEDLERLARSHRVTLRAVHGRSKHKSVVLARQSIWQWLHEVIGKSYPEIGMLFNRDHTTVVHSVHRLRDRERRDAQAFGDGGEGTEEAGE